ncbi:APC family permease [Pseudomonas juntendi]|uniref:APC family permease n=1 Tax=Pseudomonas juntendi TaxID=2666183 RepID=A0ABD4YA02_9PSED|nr:APC family permease [Pseudomonas juntendi]MDH0756165.1 APC family permease [Pseudomonas juntendi]MDH1919849.1 APC family permease [Pseudomonas juntendi]
MTIITSDSGGLKQNAIGWVSIFFMVITTNGPLTAMAGGVPVSIALGNGFGLPGSYVIACFAYLVFAIGFCAMSRHMNGAGAFYAYVSRGLGASAGIATAAMAVFAYYGVLLAVYGMFGFFVSEALQATFNITVHWGLVCIICATVAYFMSTKGIDFSGRVLIALMVGEVGIIFLCDWLGFWDTAFQSAYNFDSFKFDTVFTDGFGPSLIFVVASFMGFETAAIYSQEVRDPHKSIPKAMYASIAFIGVLYAGSIWLMLNWYGADEAVKVANSNPGAMWFDMLEKLLGSTSRHIAMALVITSLFGAILSFTNVISRYWYVLGSTHVLSEKLARTSTKTGAPVTAALLHFIISIFLIAACMLVHADPMMQVLPFASTPAAVGVVLVQCLAAIAVIFFFYKRKIKAPIIKRLLAPLLSVELMSYFLYQMIANVGLLAGREDFFAYALALSIPVIGLIGWGYSMHLKKRHVAKFSALSEWVALN